MKKTSNFLFLKIFAAAVYLTLFFMPAASAAGSQNHWDNDSRYIKVRQPESYFSVPLPLGADSKFYLDTGSVKTISSTSRSKTMSANIICVITPVTAPKYQISSYYKINLLLTYNKSDKTLIKASPFYYRTDNKGNIIKNKRDPEFYSARNRMNYDLFKRGIIYSIIQNM